MPFSKFLDQLKNQSDKNFTRDAAQPTVPVSFDDSVIVESGPKDSGQTKRRWSYVTYLNKGTLHAEGDNLMLGL